MSYKIRRLRDVLIPGYNWGAFMNGRYVFGTSEKTPRQAKNLLKYIIRNGSSVSFSLDKAAERGGIRHY